MKPTIPRFEPEVVQAEANRRFRGNTDKVATTSFSGLKHLGVQLSSRYSKARELELMAEVLGDLEPAQRACIARFYCDSKASAFFEVHFKPRWFGDAQAIGERICLSLLQRNDGYNGVHVQLPDGREIAFGGDWAEP